MKLDEQEASYLKLKRSKAFSEVPRRGGWSLWCRVKGCEGRTGHWVDASPWDWRAGSSQLGTCPGGLCPSLVICTHPQGYSEPPLSLAWQLHLSPPLHFDGSLELLSFTDHLLEAHQLLLHLPACLEAAQLIWHLWLLHSLVDWAF